jgi:hypothetical protein
MSASSAGDRGPPADAPVTPPPFLVEERNIGTFTGSQSTVTTHATASASLVIGLMEVIFTLVAMRPVVEKPIRVTESLSV